MPVSDVDLNRVLDALERSYAVPGPLNNLETHTLPNRRAVIEAFAHLQHVLFLGFFSTQAVASETLRSDLDGHLRSAASILIQQVGRACAWQDRSTPEPRCVAWCTSTVTALLQALPDIREFLIGDVEAAFANDPAAESVEEVVFCYPGIVALTAHRIAHVLFELEVPFIPRILTEHAHSCTGIDIHPGARLGKRVFIDHGTGVVIGATTVIGANVRLYQGVTLGAHSVDPSLPRGRVGIEQRHPTLEDDVTVYAGATILGGDTVIGKGSLIGGNVWLTRSVPPHSRILFRAPESS